jgi:hypothetical protein
MTALHKTHNINSFFFSTSSIPLPRTYIHAIQTDTTCVWLNTIKSQGHQAHGSAKPSCTSHTRIA